MAADNIDHADLVGVSYQGLVAESVDMSRVWDISWIPLVFSDLVGAGSSHDNEYFSWTRDKLQAQDLDNAYVDGQDLTQDNTNLGTRVGNHSQTLTKRVSVSHRARAAGTIAYADALGHQVMYRQQEARRDWEGIMLENQGSVTDDGATAGRVGSFPSWLVTNTDRGVGGADGGFSAGQVAAPTAGQARAITETMIRDMCEAVYLEGGNPGILSSVPRVIRRISEYMFTSSARIATLQRDEQGNRATGLGTVNVFITDYDVSLEFRPNRLQNTYDSSDGTPKPVANVFIMDPAMVTQSTLYSWRLEEQGRTGLATPMQIAADLSLKVNEESAHGLLADIDPAVAMTA